MSRVDLVKVQHKLRETGAFLSNAENHAIADLIEKARAWNDARKTIDIRTRNQAETVYELNANCERVRAANDALAALFDKGEK